MMRLSKAAVLIGCAAAGLFLLSACSSDAPQVVERARPAMGSELELTAWTSNEAAALSAFESVFAEFDRLENLLSVWQPGSDVVRLNEAAGTRPIPVAEDTRRVLAASAEAFALSQGSFDPTFGRLAEVWKFDHDRDNRVPTRKEIDARLAFVDGRKVEVDRPPGTAFVTRKGVRLHLGGIGKGFAVDRAVKMLRDLGLKDVMVQAGGDLFASGHREGRPWRLGIADPRDPATIFASLDVSDAAFSTSGDYERFFIAGGVRYHHIIDTRTGEPARGCRSVTVLAPTALTADWMSTAVFILGPLDGMALVERMPDVEAVIVTADNRVIVSTGLRARLRMLREPTDSSP
jgi:thiamine biosynthesis lipoprotein